MASSVSGCASQDTSGITSSTGRSSNTSRRSRQAGQRWIQAAPRGSGTTARAACPTSRGRRRGSGVAGGRRGVVWLAARRPAESRALRRCHAAGAASCHGSWLAFGLTPSLRVVLRFTAGVSMERPHERTRDAELACVSRARQHGLRTRRRTARADQPIAPDPGVLCPDAPSSANGGCARQVVAETEPQRSHS